MERRPSLQRNGRFQHHAAWSISIPDRRPPCRDLYLFRLYTPWRPGVLHLIALTALIVMLLLRNMGVSLVCRHDWDRRITVSDATEPRAPAWPGAALSQPSARCGAVGADGVLEGLQGPPALAAARLRQR